MPLGTSTKPGSFPAHMFGAPRESLMQGSPRFSPRENRAEFPQRPSQAELVRINKDLTFSHPPAPLRAISAFVSRWVTGWGGGVGGRQRGSLRGYFPFYSVSSSSYLACKLPPAHAGRQQPLSPQPQSTGLGFPIHY